MNKKKIIVTSAVLAATAISGTYFAFNHPASATDSGATTESTKPERKELSEEKKAEIKAKLEAMTDEERQAWLESHKNPSAHKRDGSLREKPGNMTDEEWEDKKAERKAKIKEKLASMTEEEKAEWLKNHPKKSDSSTTE